MVTGQTQYKKRDGNYAEVKCFCILLYCLLNYYMFCRPKKEGYMFGI